MRPGQLDPTDFEIAIIDHLARQDPSITESAQALHVLSRDFTGVGSFTKFRCDESASTSPDRHLSLEGTINMPGVPNGMGAILFCRGTQPECLEIHTYGEDHWDGVYDGFSIERTTVQPHQSPAPRTRSNARPVVSTKAMRMSENPENGVRYRFATFGARGTVTLKSDSVHVRTWSNFGWWEQQIPLEHLNPNCATLNAMPPSYRLVWAFAFFAIFFGGLGIISGVAWYPQKIVGMFILLSGVCSIWFLYPFRRAEWILFLSPGLPRGVNYTRQGPDQDQCDAFTRQMVDSIKAAQQTRNTTKA